MLAEKESLSKEKLLDKMLLVLHDALLLQLAEEWTRKKVANVPADEAYELARWWSLGQNVGSKPLFDGICSMCGALLYGVLNKSSAGSNKSSGPPCNRDGQAVTRQDGTPDAEAQPPFLLRYSPQLFAKEAPEMFSHDPETTGCASKKAWQSLGYVPLTRAFRRAIPTRGCIAQIVANVGSPGRGRNLSRIFLFAIRLRRVG